MKQITILLAEKRTFVRAGLRKLIELDDHLEVVAEAEGDLQVIALARKLNPAIVLMDVNVLLLNELDATRRMLKALPTTKLLILSGSAPLFKRGAHAVNVGWSGQHPSAKELSRTIRQVQRGKKLFRLHHLAPIGSW